MQEAYRPLCSKYSLCCANWVPPRGGPVWVPPQGVRVPPRGSGYPPGGSGYPPTGGSRYRVWVQVPPQGVRIPPRGGQSGYPPSGGSGPGTPQGGPGAPRGGDPGSPPLWTDRWMDGRTDACQNITFPRTPYAGGNKWVKLETRSESRWTITTAPLEPEDI